MVGCGVYNLSSSAVPFPYQIWVFLVVCCPPTYSGTPWLKNDREVSILHADGVSRGVSPLSLTLTPALWLIVVLYFLVPFQWPKCPIIRPSPPALPFSSRLGSFPRQFWLLCDCKDAHVHPQRGRLEILPLRRFVCPAYSETDSRGGGGSASSESTNGVCLIWRIID